MGFFITLAAGSTAVITVNWNNLAATRACLRSLIDAVTPDVFAVIVDNASDEDPAAELLRQFPSASVVRLSRNLGYAAGCNAGARCALGKGAANLLFLNNDATVDPATLPVLIEASNQYADAVLAPKIVYASNPGRVWSAGGRLRRPWMVNQHIGRDEAASSYEHAAPLDWATGCALFVPASTYQRVGPFDEGYFLYLEDLEWCLRAASRGIEVRFIPNAIVYHDVSSTARRLPTPDVLYYGCRNTYHVAFRHSRLSDRPRMAIGLTWTVLKIALRNLDPGHRTDPAYRARTSAAIDFLLGRRGQLNSSITEPG